MEVLFILSEIDFEYKEDGEKACIIPQSIPFLYFYSIDFNENG